MPGKNLSEARSFPEEEPQSRRGPQPQTQVELQQKTQEGRLPRTQVEQPQTRMEQPQKLRARLRPLRMAEDRHQLQYPRGLGRQSGEFPGESQML